MTKECFCARNKSSTVNFGSGCTIEGIANVNLTECRLWSSRCNFPSLRLPGAAFFLEEEGEDDEDEMLLSVSFIALALAESDRRPASLRPPRASGGKFEELLRTIGSRCLHAPLLNGEDDLLSPFIWGMLRSVSPQRALPSLIFLPLGLRLLRRIEADASVLQQARVEEQIYYEPSSSSSFPPSSLIVYV
mmetsp:Transcript_9340/g.15175  ORF Transcript_9340/g.15175 Transcript_9340/m.15175 type:complete len:190 (+) Transcript_9340:448-1017(+)